MHLHGYRGFEQENVENPEIKKVHRHALGVVKSLIIVLLQIFQGVCQ